MDYVKFGSAGVKVSRLALGLGLRGQASESEAEQLIRRAFDRGVNLFDCANVYGPGDDRANAGRSEVILGRALGHARTEVVITSKVASRVGPGPNDEGGSRSHIFREIERSLRRLGTDYLDVYLLHRFDPDTPLDEQLRALDDVARQGKARYVGVCNYAAWQVCRALWIQDRLSAAPLVVVQNPYSLLNRGLEAEMFPLVRSLGLGVMAYAPLGTGLLSGTYRSEALPEGSTLWGGRRRDAYLQTMRGRAAEVLAVVREIAEETGATPAQVALRWVLAHPEITVAISGADTAAQIEENVKALDAALAPEHRERLDERSAGLGMLLDGPQFG